MMAESTGDQSPNPPPHGEPQSSVGAKLTPELIHEVTQKVYAMLLRDLRIERERHGHFGQMTDRRDGGYG